MAERKKSQSRVEQAQQKVDQLEKEERAPSALADPEATDQPSPPRHWIYIAAIILGGLVLNVLLIALLGGSTTG